MIDREPGEKIGMTIKGGAGGAPGNPNNSADEGVFICKVRKLPSIASSDRLSGTHFVCGKDSRWNRTWLTVFNNQYGEMGNRAASKSLVNNAYM